jgi:hypothetical protein
LKKRDGRWGEMEVGERKEEEEKIKWAEDGGEKGRKRQRIWVH